MSPITLRRYSALAFILAGALTSLQCNQPTPEPTPTPTPTPTPQPTPASVLTPQETILPPVPTDPTFPDWKVIAENPKKNGTPGVTFDEAATADALRAKFPDVTITEPVLEAMKREALKGYIGRETNPLESGGFIFTNGVTGAPSPTGRLQIYYATGPGNAPQISTAAVYIDYTFAEKLVFFSRRPLEWENNGAWHSHHIYASVEKRFSLLYPSGGDVQTANNTLRPESAGGLGRLFFLMPLAHIWPDQKEVRIRLYVFFRDESDTAWVGSPAVWYPLTLTPQTAHLTTLYLIGTQFEYEALGKLPKQWYVANRDALNFALGLLAAKAAIPNTTLSLHRQTTTTLLFHIKADNGKLLDFEFPKTFPTEPAILYSGGTSSRSSFTGPIDFNGAKKFDQEAAGLLQP